MRVAQLSNNDESILQKTIIHCVFVTKHEKILLSPNKQKKNIQIYKIYLKTPQRHPMKDKTYFIQPCN